MKYKYTLKSLFITILWIAIPLAIFLRPIRYVIENAIISWTDFINGFLILFYWAFWLCYNETRLIDPEPNFSSICGVGLAMICYGVVITSGIQLLANKFVYGNWRGQL